MKNLYCDKLCSRFLALAAAFVAFVASTGLQAADVNVLIIGSSRDSADNGGISGTSNPFPAAAIRTQLYDILNGDPGLDNVNVTLLDRSAEGYSTSVYSLAQWFHYPYPAGVETTTRWPNLRGESGVAGTNWDYVILIGDPYTIEYMPGIYAHGVGLVAEEVAKGGGETILLMPWPTGTGSSVNHYREVVYRAGRTGGYKVAPAALAWEADSASPKPAPDSARGAYICAASIYSTIWNKSAEFSGYTYDDTLANAVYSTVTTQNAVQEQYTGSKMNFQNPYLMLGDKRREVRYSERGSSTETYMASDIRSAFGRCQLQYDDFYRDKYNSNTPLDDGMGWPDGPLPIGFNYGRQGLWDVNSSIWQLTFGFLGQTNTHNNVADADANYANENDIHLAEIFSKDIDYADQMKGGDSTQRNAPIRLLWGGFYYKYPDQERPVKDNAWHLNGYWQISAANYLVTQYTGRCPLDPEPTTMTKDWYAKKVGYETAWRVGNCSSRAPGFKVMPSSSAALTVTPSTTETMSVQFIFPPKNDVTVNISVSNANAASLNKTSMTFTPANYKVAQTVVVSGLNGALTTEDFNVQFSTVSTDEAYDELSDSWAYTVNRPLTVTFNANNGTAPNPTTKSVIYSSTYGTLATTTRIGYAFNGWFTAASGGTVVESTTTVTATTAHTLYAQWIPTYNVTFDATGGTTPSPTTKTVTSGATYGTLATTTRTGYIFNGWFTAASGGTLVESATTVTATTDHTLYARWTLAATYMVSYDGNGNTGGTVPSNQTKTEGTPLTLATNSGNLTKTGYTFAGWNTAANGSGTNYAAGASYTADAAVTLYARWNTPPTANAGPDQMIELNGSAPWTPAMITTKVAWYDASDSSTITQSGGSVSQLIDKTSNGYDVIQTVGAKQPTLSNFNGLTALDFNAANGQYLEALNTLSLLDGMTIVSVYDTDKTTEGRAFGVRGTGTNKKTFAMSQDNTMRYDGANSTGSIAASTGKFLRVATKNAAASFVEDYINGTQNISKSITLPDSQDVYINIANAVYDFGGGFDGRIGESILIDGVITTDVRQKLEGYLAQKWGLSGSLPTGHPYKSVAPSYSGATATLDGTATDADGDVLTTTWSKVSGPGTVSFANPSAVDTTATFTEVGAYVLRLTANDGSGPVYEEMTITVCTIPAKYASWVSGGGFINAFTSTGLTDNPDGDSSNNLMEFALGTDPTLQDAGSLAINGTVNGSPVPVNAGGGVFEYYFVRRKDHGTSGSVSYTVQFSDDLTGFTNSVVTPTFVVNSSADSDYEVVKVPFPGGFRFGRLQVVVTP